MDTKRAAASDEPTVPATFEELQEFVDRNTMEITVWQRVLRDASSNDPSRRRGQPSGERHLDHLAAALRGIRAMYDVCADPAPEHSDSQLAALSAPDRREAYASWLVLLDVHPDAERMLDRLRPLLKGYPAREQLDRTQATARAAVLERTPSVFAQVFLRPAFARSPLEAPLTGPERLELSLLVQAISRSGEVTGNDSTPVILVEQPADSARRRRVSDRVA